MSGSIAGEKPQFGLTPLCTKCRNIFDDWKGVQRFDYPYYEDISSWLASVKSGCVVCLRLYQSLGKEEIERVKILSQPRSEVELKLYSRYSGTNLEEPNLVGSSSMDPYKIRISFIPRGSASSLWVLSGVQISVHSSVVSGGELDLWTGSDRSLSFAKKWVKTCINSHSLCHKIGSATPPRRLIEINLSGIRLYSTTATESCPPYVTLSHCWGELDILKLKKSNVDILHEGISTEALCKTFQEAIVVTRALGYSYLWIDSLCIIQDDDDDWLHESAAMAKVYGNGVANIAASNAKDGSIGLFFERDVLRASRYYIKTNTSEILEPLDVRVYERCLMNSLLSSRAWAFQERYLARRTIHFTADQVICECRCGIVCEGTPIEEDGGRGHYGRFPFPYSDDPKVWPRIVELYSEALLTYSKDKLVALSGVARQLQAKSQDQYCAGVWRENMERQLCWGVAERGHTTGRTPLRSKFYRAPSWSWASTSRGVTWDLYHTTYMDAVLPDQVLLSSVLNVDLSPLGSDPLGQLQDAKLKLKSGPLMAIKSIASMSASQSKDSHINIRHYDGTAFRLEACGKTYYDVETPNNNAAEKDFFLPIVQDTENSEGSESSEPTNETWITGLILARDRARGKGYFVRLGVFDITFEDKMYQELMQLLSQHPEPSITDDLYEQVLEPDENGIAQYIITLV